MHMHLQQLAISPIRISLTPFLPIQFLYPPSNLSWDWAKCNNMQIIFMVYSIKMPALIVQHSNYNHYVRTYRPA